MNHIDLDLTLSFDRKQLAGTAVHHLTRSHAARVLELDTRDLTIDRVRTGTDGHLEPVSFELAPPVPIEGRKLRIDLPAGVDRVEVTYATSPGATGLQWLSPAQTAGKRYPFLYSQSQAIHARSWVPCIDTPRIRVTFDATLRLDNGLRVVMAAEDRTRAGEPGVFRFHMPQPIPSYLFALAAGELDHRDLGARSGVWAEPSILDRAAWEFADTEHMMEVAEQLYGPYRWGRYDVLVMPPAFPLGGMENPRLTFASPTVLAGDRSMVSLIAHELAHSWSGNLATNASWADLWLNEGFTVYFERRILEALYGKRRAELDAVLGRERLEAAIRERGPQSRHTWLLQDLTGRDPDEALNEIPYEKGYLLLRRLEEVFGRETFDAFLRGHFEAHAFQSLSTDEFLAWLEQELLSRDRARAAQVDVRAWVFGPGLPADAPRARDDAFDAVDRVAEGWLAGGEVAAGSEVSAAGGLTAERVAAWTAQERIHFLRHMPADLSREKMAELEQVFGLENAGNAELVSEWLRLSIVTGYVATRTKLRAFLLEVGRGRFLKPLYKALASTPEGRLEANWIYAEARPGYHAMTRAAIDGLLGVGRKVSPEGEEGPGGTD